MKNIYDIRKSECLLFILHSSKTDGTIGKLVYKKCAVFVNLYYQNTVGRYMKYLNRIPCDIDIYIYSSSEDVLEKAQILQNRHNIQYYLKENRGRDISTLLVIAGKTIHQYEYICFLHDKKENAEYLETDTDVWIDNLWGNTVGSAQYIEQVLKLFEDDDGLGLLVPPEAFGTYITHWYGDTWLSDYSLCKSLAKDLKLDTNITEDKMPFTIGTVFWAKTKALNKLFEKKWNYKDFPEETMPIDGTISHAIERIFGYAAQDAGYKTGTIMSNEYASWLLLSAQEHMRTMFHQLQKREHVYNMAQVANLDEREEKLGDFCSQYDNIYIYGAGNYGKSLYHFMKDRGWRIEGFVVSTHKRIFSTVEGLKVWELQELDSYDTLGIIIGVSYEYQGEVETMLDAGGFNNYIYGC